MSVTLYLTMQDTGGYLFGIEPNKKEAVKAVVQVILDRLESSCPFCGEGDFDKPGLKSHFERGDCEEYNNTEVIVRVF